MARTSTRWSPNGGQGPSFATGRCPRRHHQQPLHSRERCWRCLCHKLLARHPRLRIRSIRERSPGVCRTCSDSGESPAAMSRPRWFADPLSSCCHQPIEAVPSNRQVVGVPLLETARSSRWILILTPPPFVRVFLFAAPPKTGRASVAHELRGFRGHLDRVMGSNAALFSPVPCRDGQLS